MIAMLEEEARRRREELERLGAVPDYEGKVKGPVGPGGDERDILDLEHQLDVLSAHAGSSRADLDRIESIWQKFLELQSLRQKSGEDAVKWYTGLGAGLKGTADDLTSGVLLMGYPEAMAKAIGEAQPRTLQELYSAMLVGIGRQTGELINPVNLVPYHEVNTFYQWYKGEIDLSWDQVAGLGAPDDTQDGRS